MTDVIKIALYGDSLALPRKGVVKYSERYVFLIQQWLKNNFPVEYFEVKDRAKGAITISEILKQYEHDSGYYDLPGDLVIFQTGIVDCAPRPVNDDARNRIDKLPNWIKKIVIRYLHTNRSEILKKGKFYVKTEKGKYNTIFKTLLNKATGDYHRVYVVNICPTNSKMEAHSPGLTKSINEYNTIIEKVINDLGKSNIHLVDINKHINNRYAEINDYLVKEDGHHITAFTHEVIADQIIKNEMKYIKSHFN